MTNAAVRPTANLVGRTPITDCVADIPNRQAVATTTDGQRYRISLYSEGETVSLAAAVKERGWIKPAYWSPIGP